MTESVVTHLHAADQLPQAESVDDRNIDMPDEWGRQSFPASDPPQNW